MIEEKRRKDKEDAIYSSPVTGMTHDSGSWLFDLTEEELDRHVTLRKEKERSFFIPSLSRFFRKTPR